METLEKTLKQSHDWAIDRTFGEKHPATEEYLASIKPKDSVITKKQNSSS